GGVPAGRRLGDVRTQPAGRTGPPAGVAGAEAGPAPGTGRRARPPRRRRHRRGADAGHVEALPVSDGGWAVTTARPLAVDLLREVEQFLFREARLADEGDYDGWEALWTDDRLRRVDGAWRLASKKVMLVDNDRPLSTLAFLV